MKVDVAGLLAAAQRLTDAAMLVQGTGPGELSPLAPDTTSVGAAARLKGASLQVWGSACEQASSLASAAAHLIMIAAKFATQEEANKLSIASLQVQVAGIDAGSLATLAPVPPLNPDVRLPLPPLANLSGEAFSQMVTAGSSGGGAGFTTNATNNGTAAEIVARTLREVAATVPDMWDSPEGAAALSGRLMEHADAITTIADRWSDLGDEAQKHANDYSQAVTAVPKPKEFKENEARLQQAQRERNSIAVSQLLFQRGELEQNAIATEQRYASDTELSTSPKGALPPQAPGAGSPAGGRAARRAPAAVNKAAAGTGEAAQVGQAGDAAGQLAQLLPAALGAIGGLVGGTAGMLGQIPQALMQSGQGLAQAATQGLCGLASKTPPDAELSKSVGDLKPEELSKAKGGGASAGGGGGATHPAGSLGPPVTPSTSHTAPTMPAGASAPSGPTPAGGSAMGAMPMGMPMGGLMPHGAHGGNGAAEKVHADKKVVVPPQPHTEPVTGRVSDRTAAAAEAARARAESDDPDDDPPRGPVMRRITLAPLHDERQR